VSRKTPINEQEKPMNRNKLVGSILIIVLLVVGSGAMIAYASAANPDLDARTPQSKLSVQALAANQPIIVDHTSVDIHAVPQHWIEQAKETLHIAYGHTSHGSQLTDGMSGLVGFANNGGLGLALPDDIFAWNDYGTDGALDLHDYAMDGDVGYYPQWVENTRAYLGDPDPETGRGTSHPDTNVIIWSWCGQASGRSEQTMLDTYLLPMTELELDYPGVTFVYMTGHADGTGEEGNLHLRNQQIRDYCIANNKVLFDFYDIELYDPDGNYYGDKYVLDTCYYDGNGDGNPWNDDTNWATAWQGSHTQNVDWYSCSCAHSQALNCNQKAYAVWWLWARLAGWGGAGSQMTASTEVAFPGDTITYTIVVQDVGAPLTATVYLTNVLPTGLSYIPGSITATAGTVNDDTPPLLGLDALAPATMNAVNAPAATTLRWSGVLTPTPVVTVTYAVTVSATTRQTITNTAIIAAPGYAPITRTTAVVVMRPSDWPDLTPSYKMASAERASFGEHVAYTVVISNATGPLSETVLFTDTVPAGMVYVPGTLTATTGTAVDALAPTLTWSGVLTPTPAITITYTTAVTYAVPGSTAIFPQVITNTATIAAPGYQTITRTAVVRTNWYSVYLPLVLRQ
jgi:uncharacterized repeat protein (TIGR01451 family)